MKRFLILTLIIILLTGVTIYFLPYWWIIIVVPFVISLFAFKNGFHAFFSGFLSIAILNLIVSIWRTTNVNDNYISAIGELIKIPGGTIGLIAVITLLGAFMGGLGALTATLLAQLFDNKKRR